MIKVDVTSKIAVIQMDHGRANAMDLEFCCELTRALSQVASSDSGAAILVGNDRVFSAGVDLVKLLDHGQEYLEQFLPELVNCFKACFQFPKPLVAAIDGHAVAGGCIIATACDRRLIHKKAKIGIPELRVGVPLPSIGIEIIRFAVDPGALQSMLNFGKTFRGEEAIRVGLADQVVGKDELLSRAIGATQQLLAIPATVFEITKKQMRAPANRIVEQNEAEFEARVFELWKSSEIRSVIEEYVSKRL